MINYRADFTELNNLAISFYRGAQNLFPRGVTNGAMREAAKPMLRGAIQEAPVSGGGRQRISLRHRGRNANEYRRGGATRRDLRTKTVSPSGDEASRIIVGVSSKSGHVGWRTHFRTRPNKQNRTMDNFLQRAYDQTIGQVVASVSRFFVARSQAYLNGQNYRSRR
ncbi:hypothetical protein [Tellurirhabdus bombi]|uniref:hypothetical protein n=1 Tax=Tellurirhabdus bombi TaxID=2907205 RepID=UPI001F19515D|nr:hypothetical protein [Tellurirhabdus bombi]